MRLVWLGIGWTAVGGAFAGVWLPLVPTVPLLLVALWAFARGSPRARQWLFEHPRFGPTLHDWHAHGAIPTRAKVASVVAMTASFAILWWTTGLPGWALALIALLFVAISAFVVSRPAPARG
jgi:hypothetical protein